MSFVTGGVLNMRCTCSSFELVLPGGRDRCSREGEQRHRSVPELNCDDLGGSQPASLTRSREIPSPGLLVTLMLQ